MVSINDVLKASKNLPVDDIFAQLWGRKLSSDYTIAVYTGTLPAVLAGTKAGYLHGYKIYGNTEQTGAPTPENPIYPSECGERTGNLFDKSATYTAGAYTNLYTISGLDTSLSYTCSTSLARISGASAASIYLSQTTSASAATNGVWAGEEKTFTPNENGELYVLVRNTTAGGAPAVADDVIAGIITIMLNEGSTALPYEPYGYKLPLTSGNTPVDIYIGDDTLSTEEYVDSGTGKIYHMVGGVLTPTDPPVPFPQIPTTAGSTTISWGGQGLAPSEVEFEYERRR